MSVEVLRTAPWPFMHVRPAARLYGVSAADIEALIVEAGVRAVRVQNGAGGWAWALNAVDLDRWAKARALAEAAALGVGHYVVAPPC
ncbi:hypothetical protein MURUCUTUMBU_82 [Mycobacterium phage Murucutumbu]|uniref:Helix-turn-helix DNA binding domain protein n=1 Tax=Mycobacterium phage Murucutumbu TaxID=1560286 RepID=A0A0A0RMG2_9CAUD|nr:hypothetical protein AVV71_gp19 [Mycobacterium phage Murucutumbu]AIW03068.1 hypothetical protein MURUCUTUMBU_82 [Mycobacterium phage Murucutumbu]